MAHIFFIDPIEKLNIKKDSSLMTGLAYLEEREDVYLLFEKDFYIQNHGNLKLKLYKFSGSFARDGYYLESFKVEGSLVHEISKKDTIHMRIDPPYDMRYQRYLWMLDFLTHSTHCKVLNNPRSIMLNNEKIVAFKLKNSVNSFVGTSSDGLKAYIETIKKSGVEEVVLKPLDLYSGIGVIKEKISDKLEEVFLSHVKKYQGAIIVQPFLSEVLKGEHRSLFFNGEEVGTIIKKPNAGEFLTNIAQGAKFEKATLKENVYRECKSLAEDLHREGVSIVAYDILGETITEVNVTCPGLFVEVSYANESNIAKLYAQTFS